MDSRNPLCRFAYSVSELALPDQRPHVSGRHLLYTDTVHLPAYRTAHRHPVLRGGLYQPQDLCLRLRQPASGRLARQLTATAPGTASLQSCDDHTGIPGQLAPQPTFQSAELTVSLDSEPVTDPGDLFG